jgi:hypothetical protein
VTTYEALRAAQDDLRAALDIEDAQPCEDTEIALALAYYVCQCVGRAYHSQQARPVASGGWNASYEQHAQPFRISTKVRRFVDGDYNDRSRG